MIRIVSCFLLDSEPSETLQVLDSCGRIASFPGVPVAVSGSRSGYAMTWGQEALTVNAGVYRLCWCRDASENVGHPDNNCLTP